MLESLEPRRLLAATLDNGVLTVTGTRKDDFIRIVQKPTTLLVTVNKTLYAFKPTHVRSVIVNGNRGDDRILLYVGVAPFLGDVSGTVDTSVKRLLVNGGGGDDAIDSTGGSWDTLIGGDGNDLLRTTTYNSQNQLRGEAGDDTLIGSIGSEDFSGGSGIDTVDYSRESFRLYITLDDIADDGTRGVVFDSAGRVSSASFQLGDLGSEGDNVHSDIETVLGGQGDDSIVGTGADNLIIGSGGDDTLIGGGGDDTLNGGAGLDLLSGGSGRDVLIGETDADTYRGGPGSDVVINPDIHDGFPDRDVENASSTGTVDRYATVGDSFGGGNTGWVIRLPQLFTDIDVTGQVGKTKALIGQTATAYGTLEIRNFIERGDTPVIVVQSLKLSPPLSQPLVGS